MILYVNCILSSSYYYIITCTTVPPYRLSVVSIDEDEIDAAAWHDLEEVAAWTTHPINRECLRALSVDGVDGAVDEDEGAGEEGEAGSGAPRGAIREITTRLRPDRPPFKLYF